MMDVEKLIEAAKICSDPDGDCDDCPFKAKCVCGLWPVEVLAVVDHYETLLTSERSKVIAEAREWVEDDKVWLEDHGFFVQEDRLLTKLDSMGADNGKV